MSVLRQSDPAWAKARLGEPRSGHTIGDSGCLLTLWAQALRDLGIDPEATPLTVLKATLEAPGRIWYGPAPVQPALGAFYGLFAEDLVRCPPEPAQRARAMLVAALEAGGRAAMHVDHDSAKVRGDPEGDHFVLARRLEQRDGETVVVYADTASGKEDELDLRTLSGTTQWSEGGEVRPYHLRAVRPILRR